MRESVVTDAPRQFKFASSIDMPSGVSDDLPQKFKMTVEESPHAPHGLPHLEKELHDNNEASGGMHRAECARNKISMQ